MKEHVFAVFNLNGRIVAKELKEGDWFLANAEPGPIHTVHINFDDIQKEVIETIISEKMGQQVSLLRGE